MKDFKKYLEIIQEMEQGEDTFLLQIAKEKNTEFDKEKIKIYSDVEIKKEFKNHVFDEKNWNRFFSDILETVFIVKYKDNSKIFTIRTNQGVPSKPNWIYDDFWSALLVQEIKEKQVGEQEPVRPYYGKTRINGEDYWNYYTLMDKYDFK